MKKRLVRTSVMQRAMKSKVFALCRTKLHLYFNIAYCMPNLMMSVQHRRIEHCCLQTACGVGALSTGHFLFSNVLRTYDFVYGRFSAFTVHVTVNTQIDGSVTAHRTMVITSSADAHTMELVYYSTCLAVTTRIETTHGPTYSMPRAIRAPHCNKDFIQCIDDWLTNKSPCHMD